MYNVTLSVFVLMKFCIGDFNQNLLKNSDFQAYYFIIKISLRKDVNGLLRAAHKPSTQYVEIRYWRLANLHFIIPILGKLYRLKRTLWVILSAVLILNNLHALKLLKKDFP